MFEDFVELCLLRGPAGEKAQGLTVDHLRVMHRLRIDAALCAGLKRLACFNSLHKEPFHFAQRIGSGPPQSWRRPDVKLGP